MDDFTQEEARALLKKLAAAFRHARHKTLAEAFELYLQDSRDAGANGVIRSELAEILRHAVGMAEWRRRRRREVDAAARVREAGE
jgi:hypothetical protein